MAQPDTLTLICHAKVNLALSVAAPRPDGMHPIASLMVALEFGDELTLTRRAAGGSEFDIRFDDRPPTEQARVDWPLEKDLAFRAHRLLEAHAGRSLPVRLALRKRVPAGAGLGGGSSDAAFTLVGLNRLFDLKLDSATLAQLAAQLGSDIAFFIAVAHDQRAAVVTGLGERVEPITLPRVHLVLIFPPFGCPTGPVYKAFDAMLGTLRAAPASSAAPASHADAARIIALTKHNPIPSAALFNDLAEPAFIVRPELRRIRDELARALNVPVHVTGSGSTLFVITPDARAAATIAARAATIPGLHAAATTTL